MRPRNGESRATASDSAERLATSQETVLGETTGFKTENAPGTAWRRPNFQQYGAAKNNDEKAGDSRRLSLSILS
jgi:hypothetical protein